MIISYSYSEHVFYILIIINFIIQSLFSFCAVRQIIILFIITHNRKGFVDEFQFE